MAKTAPRIQPKHGLWPSHGAHDQRHGDERPHSDHVDHVQSSRAADADSANRADCGRVASLLGVGGWHEVIGGQR